MPAPKKATDAASRHFAEHFGDDEYTIARTASGAHPKDGRRIHLFLAVRSGAANDPAVELVLDDDGEHVQLAGAREALLAADVSPVPAGVVKDVKVTINPEVNDLRLGECDTFREKLTVTIPASAAVAPADIYFLADNTGSMGTVIAAVQAGASAILSSLGPLARAGIRGRRVPRLRERRGHVARVPEPAADHGQHRRRDHGHRHLVRQRRRRPARGAVLRARPAGRGQRNRLAARGQAHRGVARRRARPRPDLRGGQRAAV